jgi:hypothetical protein
MAINRIFAGFPINIPGGSPMNMLGGLEVQAYTRDLTDGQAEALPKLIRLYRKLNQKTKVADIAVNCTGKVGFGQPDTYRVRVRYRRV